MGGDTQDKEHRQDFRLDWIGLAQILQEVPELP